MKTQKTRSIFAKTLVMATLAIGLYAAPASATIYNIGTVSSTPYINSVVLPAGNFLDNYNFSVSALANDVAASAVSLDLLLGNMSFLHINNLAFSLYDSSNTLIASSTGSPPAFDSVLGVGNYHFELAGQANFPKHLYSRPENACFLIPANPGYPQKQQMERKKI